MTTIAAEHAAEPARGSLLGRGRYAFRFWRRGRPFWGSLFVLLAGLEIIWIPYSPMGVVVHEGIAGIGGMFIGALLIMFAVSAMFAPAYRVFAGIAAILLALVALPATNFGGFLIGTLFALFGGAFAVAWAPREGLTADTRRQRRRALRPAGPGESAEAAETARIAEDDQPAPDAPAPAEGFTESEIAAAEIAAAAAGPERAGQAARIVPEPTAAPAEHTVTDPED